MKFFTGTKFEKPKCTKNCTKIFSSALKTTLNFEIDWTFYRKILIFLCPNNHFLGEKEKNWTIFRIFPWFSSTISLYFVKTLNALKFALNFFSALRFWNRTESIEIALNLVRKCTIWQLCLNLKFTCLQLKVVRLRWLMLVHKVLFWFTIVDMDLGM